MEIVDLVMGLARGSIADARPRPFGVEVADLDVDFDDVRARVAMRVLARCLGCDERAVRALVVQQRILLLLGVSEISVAEPVEAHLPCTCGQVAVVELATEELVQFAAGRRRDSLVVREGEAKVTLRLPTGDDQLRWAALAPSRDLQRIVLEDLVIDGELSSELARLADAMLSDVDPLVELQVDSTCPGCGEPVSRHVDIEQIALTRLRHARRILLEQVHAIAARYHWTEPTIAALPAWRRAEYASLARAR